MCFCRTALLSLTIDATVLFLGHVYENCLSVALSRESVELPVRDYEGVLKLMSDDSLHNSSAVPLKKEANFDAKENILATCESFCTDCTCKYTVTYTKCIPTKVVRALRCVPLLH